MAIYALSCRVLGPLAVALAFATATYAQNSEYNQPNFDPEHDFESFLPAETIDLYSGAVVLVYRDIHLPGPNGLDLDIMRWYNSKIDHWDTNCITFDREETSFGLGWQMHVGRLWVNFDSPTKGPRYRLELPGGATEEFYVNDVLGVASVSHVSRGGWGLITETVGAKSYVTALSPGGVKYRFEDSAANRYNPNDSYLGLSEIIDLVGNKISVTYENRNDNNAYPSVVTDAFLRTVSFFYADNGNVNDPDRLSRIEVKDHTGATAQYTYNVSFPANVPNSPGVPLISWTPQQEACLPPKGVYDGQTETVHGGVQDRGCAPAAEPWRALGSRYRGESGGRCQSAARLACALREGCDEPRSACA